MSVTAYPTLRLKLTMPTALKLQFLPAVPGFNASQVANKVDRAGDTMQGQLLLAADPSFPLEAATKQYVDAHSGSGAAPVDAEYITSTANATLTSERVLTDTATVTWDRTVAGQIKANAAAAAAASAIGFSAHKNGTAQTGFPHATITKVTFGTEVYDLGSRYDTTLSRWTPPAGLVSISAGIYVPASVLSPGHTNIYIYKNGSSFKTTFCQNVGIEGEVWITISDNANGTDFYEVFASSPSGSTYQVSGDTTLSFFMGSVGGGSGGSGGGTGNVTYTASSTAPVSPAAGDLWYDLSTGVLSIRVNDGTSSQWVMVAPPGGGGGFAAAPFDALAYNGMQINGSMEVSQERLTAGTNTSGTYICDGWRLHFSGTMAVAAAQGGSITAGFQSSFNFAVQTAQPSLGASDFTVFVQPIEGYRVARLAWGTASAQPITIGFWSSHTRTGTFTGAIRNSASTRSYAFAYVQASSNVAQYNTITIPGDTTGTWATDNTAGMLITFAVAAGTSFLAPSSNTWLAGNYYGGPGQVNAVASTTDVLRFTGLVVLPGIEAPTAARSPLIMRPFDQELVTCKRYWQKYRAIVYPAVSAPTFTLSVEMRAVPTVSGGGAGFTIFEASTVAPTWYQTTAALQTIVLDARL